MYEYKAICIAVYDGDTITVDIDLGFGIWMKKQKIRLYGINAPELRGGTIETKAAGRASRDRLRELILDKEIRIKTHKEDKKGKYGRWLGWAFLKPRDTGLRILSVNERLVAEGHAVHKDY